MADTIEALRAAAKALEAEATNLTLKAQELREWIAELEERTNG